MFSKVPQAENAYLALYYHPGAIHKRWWRRNFAKLNIFSGIAMADRGSDRYCLERRFLVMCVSFLKKVISNILNEII